MVECGVPIGNQFTFVHSYWSKQSSVHVYETGSSYIDWSIGDAKVWPSSVLEDRSPKGGSSDGYNSSDIVCWVVVKKEKCSRICTHYVSGPHMNTACYFNHVCQHPEQNNWYNHNNKTFLMCIDSTRWSYVNKQVKLHRARVCLWIPWNPFWCFARCKFRWMGFGKVIALVGDVRVWCF